MSVCIDLQEYLFYSQCEIRKGGLQKGEALTRNLHLMGEKQSKHTSTKQKFIKAYTHACNIHSYISYLSYQIGGLLLVPYLKSLITTVVQKPHHRFAHK